MFEATISVKSPSCISVFLRKLIENLSINRITNVQALQCALSDAAGNVILHSFAEGNHNEGISSLGFLNKTQNKIQIQCKTLDEIMVEEKLSKFDFIKIDVEGYEYNVLIGAKNSIQKYFYSTFAAWQITRIS